jgi:thioredoxin reductase (NADPH)
MGDELDVLVAGGGIAGLTAGLTSGRLGRRTLVLTGGPPGGLLLSIETIEGVPGWPGGVPGYELCPVMQEQAEAAGAEFSMGEARALERADGGWQVTADEGSYQARAVIVATGARMRELGVPGEERLRGRGVSHCASCDAPLFRERVVGVVGGGDSALQEALTLAASVKHVIVLQRGDELTAQESYRRRVLEHPQIEVRYGVVVEEILGEEKVTGVCTSDGKLELDAVFPYVGLEPNTEWCGDIATIDAPGVFAAGIVRPAAPGRAASSMGDGAGAAVAADRYLTQGSTEASSIAGGSRA